MSGRAQDAVDVAFTVAGVTLPSDYPFALMGAVVRRLPWFATDPDAGIHPIRGAPTDYGVVLLPRRAKLVLRVRRDRVADTLSLRGTVLDVGDTTLSVRDGQVQELRPYGAIYAHLVSTGSEEEEAFLSGVTAQLGALAAQCAMVCGRRQRLLAAGREIVGFSLMLHDLSAEHSLLLQRMGLGGDRKLGCGIFVPHRLAAAVGSA